MMFIFDANVVSELRRPEKANGRVRRFAAATLVANTFLSAITVLGLECVGLKIDRRDKAQGKTLRQRIDGQILPRYEGRILAIDAAVARICAGLNIPNPRAERDAFIAATALVLGMTAATRNTGDFEGTGARVFNPWEA